MSLKIMVKYTHMCIINTILIVVALTLLVPTCYAQEDVFAEQEVISSANADDLTLLSLEQLMSIEVSLASKRPEKLFETAAAIYVITEEDIRRSGAASIPEVLRLVPGLTVAQIDANKWAISARGFADRFANKMLVLIDGRSVYTPLFSGVYWDVQDTLLEDIERIEVIRGPGATLWGANAVNGIINIITKDAADTQGGLITERVGTEERGIGGFRYGGRIGENGYYRAYAKYRNIDSFVAEDTGDPSADDWEQSRAGFRFDWNYDNGDTLTIQGDVYDTEANQRLLNSVTSPVYPIAEVINDTLIAKGGNVLGRWTRTYSDKNETALQAYYDKTERSDYQATEVRDTFDIDFQHRLVLGDKHGVTWGLGYRRAWDDIKGNAAYVILPASRTDELFSAFVQDDISLSKDRLRLTLGTKFEHNDYTGLEIQPQVRLLYTPDERQTYWGSIARAVRTPSRIEHDARLVVESWVEDNMWTYGADIFGNPDFESEELTAYEIGYRVQPSDKLFFDFAGFYNYYDNLRAFELGTPYFGSDPPRIVVPLHIVNKLSGEALGFEMSSNWSISEYWRIALSYSFITVNVSNDPNVMLIVSESPIEGRAPHHQFKLRSYLDLSENLEFDTLVYYVDSLPDIFVEPYWRVDLRLGYQPTSDVDISVGVQNLLDGSRREFGTTLDELASEVEKSWYGKLTWKF